MFLHEICFEAKNHFTENGKAHCYDAKFISPAKEVVFFDKFTALNIPKIEGRILR
jgi:hypothetical protein